MDSRRACLAIMLATALASRPSAAQRAKVTPSVSTQPIDVETAEQLYAKLDYEQANAVAERVLKKTGLTHDQLTRIYRVLAVTYAVLDKEEQARDAFLQLLILDVEYQVDPNLGPRVTTPFMEARGSFRSLSAKPGIEVLPSLSSSGGSLRITTRDPTRMVKHTTVGYRWASAGEYTTASINVGDALIEVSPPPVGRTRLDYYVQALDERDGSVLEAGNPGIPRTAFADGSRAGAAGAAKNSGASVFSSPIFWLIAGAVVAGGGTAAFFALRPASPPTSASLSPLILCGTERCN